MLVEIVWSATLVDNFKIFRKQKNLQQFISSLTHYEKFQVSIFSRAGTPTRFKRGSWEKVNCSKVRDPLPLRLILIHSSSEQRDFMRDGPGFLCRESSASNSRSCLS